MCVALSYPRPSQLNGWNRAIVGHVLWDVHATGTWKAPLAPETDENYKWDEEEEEDEVSDFHFTLCMLHEGEGGGYTRPQERAKCAH